MATEFSSESCRMGHCYPRALDSSGCGNLTVATYLLKMYTQTEKHQLLPSWKGLHKMYNCTDLIPLPRKSSGNWLRW